MIKKIVLSILLLSLSITNLQAIDSKLALELARSKKITEAINRVNSIYDYINLFIMETGTNPANFAALSTQYAGLVRTGFTATDNIDFSIANNLVTFTGIATMANTTPILRQIFQNSPNLRPNALVNPATLTISIRLKAETVQFLSKSSQVKSMSPLTIFVQNSDPGCNQVAHNGRSWYIPDSVGGYTVKSCNGSVWSFISNKIDTVIYRPTIGDLNNIKPPAGTKGYIDSATAGETNEYIYDGTIWRRVRN